MKVLFKKIVPAKIRQHPKIMHLRLWLNFIFIIKGRLKSQLSIKHIKDESSIKKRSKRILIPLIETSHYQHYQLLVIAKALELRGAEVKILICGQFLDGCEIKTSKNEELNDPCYECRFNEKNTLPMFNLDVIRLNDFITDDLKIEFKNEAQAVIESNGTSLTRHGIVLDQSIDNSIIRYYYGGIPQNKALVKKVRFDHTVTAMISAEIAYKIDREWSPEIVFNNMYSYSAWEPMFEYYNVNGNRSNSVSINNFNYNGLVVNTPELFQTTKRYKKYVAWRNNKRLNKKETRVLWEFFQDRIDGNTRFFKDYNYFINSESDMPIQKLLNIDKKKRNLFLFSNVFWDIGISSHSKLFDGVIDWILQTIEIVKYQEEKVHLYIKPHPGEKNNSLSSSTGIADIIEKDYPELPANITIIDPDLNINTYNLFPYIDLGVMYNGTLGLEMMLSKIPVVTSGKTTFQGLGFAFEPKTIEEYEKILIDGDSQKIVNQDEIELYAYFYFIKTMVPFNLTKETYSNIFSGFMFDSLDELKIGNNKYLDHLCNCIIDPKNTIIEGWD